MNLHRKIIVLLLILFSCGNDDDNKVEEIKDVRYKILFDDEGYGVIIGDQSNKVIKEFTTKDDGYNSLSIIEYYQNPQTNNIYFFTIDYFGNKYSLRKVNPKDIFLSEDYNYTALEEVAIDLDTKRRLYKILFVNENKFHAILEEEGNSGFFEIITFENGNVVETQKLYDITGIYGFDVNSFCYFNDSGLLLIIHEEINTQRTTALNVNDWTVAFSHSKIQFTTFGSFGYNGSNYIFGKIGYPNVVNEYLTDMYGNEISKNTTTYRFITGSSISYDTFDDRFEYQKFSDGRNEVGYIDIDNGVLVNEGIVGTPSSRSSPIFYFNGN